MTLKKAHTAKLAKVSIILGNYDSDYRIKALGQRYLNCFPLMEVVEL